MVSRFMESVSHAVMLVLLDQNLPLLVNIGLPYLLFCSERRTGRISSEGSNQRSATTNNQRHYLAGLGTDASYFGRLATQVQIGTCWIYLENLMLKEVSLLSSSWAASA